MLGSLQSTNQTFGWIFYFFRSLRTSYSTFCFRLPCLPVRPHIPAKNSFLSIDMVDMVDMVMVDMVCMDNNKKDNDYGSGSNDNGSRSDEQQQ